MKRPAPVSSNGLGAIFGCGKTGCGKTFQSEDEALDHIETEAFDHQEEDHFIMPLVRVEVERKE